MPPRVDGAWQVVGGVPLLTGGISPDVVVIAAPIPAYAAWRAAHVSDKGGRKTVIDCWCILAPEVAAIAEVIQIGRAAQPDERPRAVARPVGEPARFRARPR